jgi:transposase
MTEAKSLREIIEAAVFAALERNNWDKQAAADELRVSLKTIYNWIKRMEANAE